MSGWADANIEGIALMLLVLAGLLVFLLAAGFVQWLVERPKRKQRRVFRVDQRCERTGSQAEFSRRLKARG